MSRVLRITPEIHQNWIDAENAMASHDGDDHPAVLCHREVGNAIYGNNLSKACNAIYEERFEDLKALELPESSINNN